MKRALATLVAFAATTGALAADVDWPMFNQTYDAQRFSALKQIDASNVGQLKEVCRVRVGEFGGFGPGPIIVGGVLYVTAGERLRDGPSRSLDNSAIGIVAKIPRLLMCRPRTLQGRQGPRLASRLVDRRDISTQSHCT